MKYSPAEGQKGAALLNVGCGERPHASFVNVDINAGPGVMRCDVREGLPFPDRSFDLVYHSTMLSLLRPDEADRLTRDCWRVLKPGGILRAVTEDLEQVCRVYLDRLEAACSGDPESGCDHEWMLLELYDQATREAPGGRMVEYLSREPLLNETFVCSRVGEQGRIMISGARARWQKSDPRPVRTVRAALSRLKARCRQAALNAVFGPQASRALEVGTFRLTSGQVSYRMYDRFSLGQLLCRAGFAAVSIRDAINSEYPGWSAVNLDLSQEGRIARPHALIMEGVRT